MCCQVDNLGNMFVCLKMRELIPLSCHSLPVILSAPWEPHEAAIPVDQATSVCLAFSTGRTPRSHLFLSRYLSGAVAVSPAFVRPCHLVPFNNSRHTLCCYISICTWFMDISVWRNASAPLVHVKTGVPRQIWCSSNLLCSFWWCLGRDGRAACSGSPHHAFTSWGWDVCFCPAVITVLAVPILYIVYVSCLYPILWKTNHSCKLRVKTAQNLTAAELAAFILTANSAGKNVY